VRERLTHFCPVCEGEPNDPFCYCNGTGGIKAADAKGFARGGEQVVELPLPPAEMPSPCFDCAFRAGSQERESCRTWAAIQQGIANDTPFYCHQGMLVGSRGEYVPLELDADGAPVGHPLCAGWLAARAKERAA
jgi:hypothetical protein